MSQEIVSAEFTEDERQTLTETPEKRRSSDFKSYYTNYASVSSTPMDIRITFSDFVKDERDKLLITEVASIAMSPQMAKALAQILTANVVRFETTHGEINMKSFVDSSSQELPKL